MVRTTRTVRRGVFGVATAAALAFGGAQALAAPAPPAPAASAERACTDQLCNQVCLATGNNGGVCGSRGICICFR